MFTSVRADEVLAPLPPVFDSAEALAGYPPIKAGAHTRRELEAVSLASAARTEAEDEAAESS